jgi:hypothetical protein
MRERTTNFQAKRVSRSYRQTINATPDQIFLLICPVREAEWLEDWDYRMIYSKSGLAEEGAVFSTPYEGEEDTIWIITEHDAIKHKVEFVRITPASRASILTVDVREKDERSSYAEITYTYTALTEDGNKFVDNYTEEFFQRNLKDWEESMNYFLETGKMLKVS